MVGTMVSVLIYIAISLICLCSQQGFGHAEEVHHLCDTKQWGNHDHSAQSTFEKCGNAFLF